MYAELDVSVVPVALNAGKFWGQNSVIIWPGIAKAKFLTPIPPGLGEESFFDRLQTEIEAESALLLLKLIRAAATGVELEGRALGTTHNDVIVDAAIV